MEALLQAPPFWTWIALAGGLLAVEVATTTGWLLWPAGAALVMGLLSLALDLTPVQAGLGFAGLTLVSTLLGRRLVPRGLLGGDDINDPSRRLVGQKGEAAGRFHHGRGRVLVEGKEWAAELEGEGPVADGQVLEVTDVQNGSTLTVRRAEP